MRGLILWSAVIAASGCGRQCETTPPRRLECEFNGDDLPQAVVGRWWVDTFAAPSATSDFGCHFETDGNMAFFVVDGALCTDGRPDTVPNYDMEFSARCRPPNGVWFMASGVRTVKITATDEGLVCEN